MPSYIITEPSRRPAARLHMGRGGAGNVATPDEALQLSRTLSSVSTNTSSSSHNASSKFSSGRGGAGNIRPSSEAAPLDFSDLETPQHNVYHVGRGGAGNWGAKEGARSVRKNSRESVESNSSARSGLMGRLSGVFTR